MPADSPKAARTGAALAGIVDDVLADALMAWAYAISIADPASPVLLTGDVTRRHDFGLGPVERGPSRCGWRGRCREAGGHGPGPVARQRIAARPRRRAVAAGAAAVNGERVIDAPTLSANERDAFAVSVALLNPFALRDDDRDAIVDAVARGRSRVALLAEDSGDLDRIAAEIRMDGWRRRALQWTIAHEPQRIGSMFSLTELLYLGDGAGRRPRIAWGMSAMGWSGCLCTRLAPPRLWRLLSGRPQLGLMAAAVPDLNLHVAMMLRELQSAGGGRQGRARGRDAGLHRRSAADRLQRLADAGSHGADRRRASGSRTTWPRPRRSGRSCRKRPTQRVSHDQDLADAACWVLRAECGVLVLVLGAGAGAGRWCARRRPPRMIRVCRVLSPADGSFVSGADRCCVPTSNPPTR